MTAIKTIITSLGIIILSLLTAFAVGHKKSRSQYVEPRNLYSTKNTLASEAVLFEIAPCIIDLAIGINKFYISTEDLNFNPQGYYNNFFHLLSKTQTDFEEINQKLTDLYISCSDDEYIHSIREAMQISELFIEYCKKTSILAAARRNPWNPDLRENAQYYNELDVETTRLFYKLEHDTNKFQKLCKDFFYSNKDTFESMRTATVKFISDSCQRTFDRYRSQKLTNPQNIRMRFYEWPLIAITGSFS